MEPEEILDLYDAEFAASYDGRFLLPQWGRESSGFELATMRDRLGHAGALLDLACGTGWFLSQFPNHERAGLDISPSMLARAQIANPGVELRQADFRDDQLDWHDRWDLVTCMWFAYCYANNVNEVEGILGNMAAWTSPEGAALLPVCDLAALGLDDFAYKREVSEFGGEMSITGVTWTWDDARSGKAHRNLVAPHADHLVSVFERHFRTVEILQYPMVVLDEHGEPWEWRRKAILATAKRRAGDAETAEVIVHPAPVDSASGIAAAGTLETTVEVQAIHRPPWRKVGSRLIRRLHGWRAGRRR